MLRALGILWLAVAAQAVSDVVASHNQGPIPFPLPYDPCKAIAGRRWVSPKEARDCLFSFPVDPVIKANTLEVITKTVAFHTSVNYQIHAPPPFDDDVHEDLLKDLMRINETDYASEFAYHLDVFAAFRRLNDGHCVNIDYCYDSIFISYLPLPLVLLTEPRGGQNVYIAPEAFKVASAEFKDEIEFWQNALPGELQGQLESLSGARVLLIDGQDPFVAVNANAEVAGGYQGLGTRQNGFFSSYSRGNKGWNYAMGNFAQKVHPLTDQVTLTVRRSRSHTIDIVTLPYRSRLRSTAKNFTDSASFRANNCVAGNTTNGQDLYHPSPSMLRVDEQEPPVAAFQQQPRLKPIEARRHHLNVMLDASPKSDLELPEHLQPVLPALNESYNVAQFYLLGGHNNQTGVLALGSFSTANITLFQKSLLEGLVEMKARGATNLIVDVTNNGGGYICVAHWLHRIIIGPKSTTEPQAGLDTAVRAGPLARMIVTKIVEGADPEDLLLYNPVQWTNASHVTFANGTEWLKPLDHRKINGNEDLFSQRLGQECQPFQIPPPDSTLFDPKDVIIISNGRCASSCSLFSITMAKLEGVRTVVVGGKQDVTQQYCGIVGGQSTDFSTIDTEIKSVKLKNHTLAPPDFLSNIVQGITWRLGFGLGANSDKPEEWQDHPADFNMPLTRETVNNPLSIWNVVAETLLQKRRNSTPALVIQS
ncbi:hypothetical protein Moror_6367 [Moniliophthora roreri MCA 2997]|uniref:Uncharacterized protein n=1 Tax=Moniliophthora roreri (strain MCA 2997) TaxID=1381753 RepID=V2XWD1_MONRO|nr:hypothetical protein Moror_6367 [Moniliophthora roreri MCA 2997]